MSGGVCRGFDLIGQGRTHYCKLPLRVNPQYLTYCSLLKKITGLQNGYVCH